MTTLLALSISVIVAAVAIAHPYIDAKRKVARMKARLLAVSGKSRI